MGTIHLYQGDILTFLVKHQPKGCFEETNCREFQLKRQLIEYKRELILGTEVPKVPTKKYRRFGNFNNFGTVGTTDTEPDPK